MQIHLFYESSPTLWNFTYFKKISTVLYNFHKIDENFIKIGKFHGEVGELFNFTDYENFTRISAIVGEIGEK